MLNLIVGVTGSVAAIKLPQLITELSPHFNLKIIVTKRVNYFIKDALQLLASNPLTPILHDEDEWSHAPSAYSSGDSILHIELRRWADLMVIAPLDAHSLAKITHGLCDNLLTSVVRAWDYSKPLYLCPAMNTFMWENPPTEEQLQRMIDRSAIVINPIVKTLACNDKGMGAMAEVNTIVEQLLKKV